MQTRFWKALKGIVKIYGMARLGVVLGVAGCFITMMFFGFMWSVGGAIAGYFVGDYLAKVLHNGKAQRFIRWYFPTMSKSFAPSTSTKLFF